MGDFGKLFLGIRGTVLALDPATGKIVWNNRLKGLGTSFVTIAGGSQVPPMASDRQKKQAAAAAAGAAAAG